MKTQKSRAITVVASVMALYFGSSVLIGQFLEALVGLGLGVAAMAFVYGGILWIEKGSSK